MCVSESLTHSLSRGVLGFPERLENALQKLMPASCDVNVHAGTYREHAAYRGAAVVASLNNFESMCVWQDEWHESKCPNVLWVSECDMWVS